MSSLALIVLIGFPTVGAMTAWAAAASSWRTLRTRTSSIPEFREIRGKMIALGILPAPLILFGFVALLLVLGEAVPDAIAQPASLAYGIPGLLSGMGTAIIYRRGLLVAVTSKEGFGRVLPLAVVSETSAVFGIGVSILLLGGASNSSAASFSGTSAAWLASALMMVGGIGALMTAWLAASAWDFSTATMWPKALARSGRGGMFTAACFALAMAVLGEWLIVGLLVVYFGGVTLVGIVLLNRARHKGGGKRPP